MKLFHQLNEEDQQNAVHYCMHCVIDEMLEDGVQINAISEHDKNDKTTLERIIEEAKQLPQEQRFEFLVNHELANPMLVDIAIDMARSAYYHPDEDMIIYHEALRDSAESEEVDDDMIETVEDLEIPVTIDISKMN